MSSSGPAHPLDVDLADLVDGVLDDARAAPIELHLADCLLCRVKCRRLRAGPPPPLRLQLDETIAPTRFAAPGIERGREPLPGELWVVGEDERMMVLVRAVEGDRVAVMPATFDVEAADDETLIVDADHSPLGAALVVHPLLTTELPRTALVSRLANVDLTGATPGAPITGPGDPRLDVRQYLADRLGAIEATPPDPQTAADAPPVSAEQFRSVLISDIRALRGDTCTVRALDGWGDILPAQRNGWAPMASIDEVGIVLVVLDTPHGLADDQDFDAARSVLTRLNATALVVLAREVTDRAEVFDAPSLNYGIDTPTGVRTPPRPLISGLAPFDAIGKFLDQHTGVRMSGPAVRGTVGHVDVAELLQEATAAAVADAVRQGARFKIAPKRRGYESLAGAQEAIDAALTRSFAGQSVVEGLVELASGTDGDA